MDIIEDLVIADIHEKCMHASGNIALAKIWNHWIFEAKSTNLLKNHVLW